MFENINDSLIKSVNGGLLLMMADGKIIETKTELGILKKREDNGEKFFCTLHFIPKKNIKFKISYTPTTSKISSVSGCAFIFLCFLAL